MTVPKLFALIFLPAALMLGFFFASATDKIHIRANEQIFTTLKDEWQIIAAVGIEEKYTEESHGALIRILENTGVRVSLISAEGWLINDSTLPHNEIIAAENHLSREEVRSALLNQPMEVERYSRTAKTDLIYYAAMLPSGNVLRVSYVSGAYDSKVAQITDYLKAVAAATILAASLFAFMFAYFHLKPYKALEKDLESNAVVSGTFSSSLVNKLLAMLDSTSAKLRIAEKRCESYYQHSVEAWNHLSEGVIALDAQGNVVAHNESASQILTTPLPSNVALATDLDMIGLFGRLSQNEPAFAALYKEKNLQVRISPYAGMRLVILNDESSGVNYSSFKADLVGNISHEIKTPLALMLTASETILKHENMPKETLDKFLQTIHKNGKRLNELLNDMLTLHKLENADNSKKTEVDIADITADLKEFIAPYMNGKTVRYDIRVEHAKVLHSHILSILSNLIINALKYSEANEVDVTIDRDRNGLRIEVADGGPLIPREERKRIFERFYSLSKSRNRENGQQGSGLGLAIVNHIAKLYTGAVSVKENHRGGNSFTVSLVER